MTEEMNLKDKLLQIRPHLILLFIPILFTVIFGAVMAPVYVENIPIAIYDMDHSENSRAIADCFYDCEVFKVTEGIASMSDIEDQMLGGKIKGAVVMPEGFGRQLAGKAGAEATVLIDGSNFLIGNNIQLFATTIFAMSNASVQMTMLEAGGMVPFAAEQSVYTMNIADRTLFNPQLGYFYYLFAGLLGIFVQQTFLSATPTVLIQEKRKLIRLPDNYDRSAVKLQVGYTAGRIIIYALLNTISMLCCLILAHKLFAYPMNGNLGYVMLIQVIFQMCLLGVALVIASLFEDATHCFEFVMFLAVPSMLACGYGWPEYMMAPGFDAVMKAVWPLYYYSNPMKDLMLKGAGWDVIGHYVIGGLIFAAVWIPIGLFLYGRKIRLIKQAGLTI